MRKLLGVVILSFAASALHAAAQTPGTAHESPYADADIAYGFQIYSRQCVVCHGPQGDQIGGVALRSGKFRNAVTDQELTRFIRTGSPAGMQPFTLDAAEMAGIIAYLRNMNTFEAAGVKTGDAARGRALFEGRGNCLQCHRVERAGSRVGPNLSDIGAVRSPASLERSLLDPNSQMMPINRPVRVVTKNGTVITGRRLNEDTYSLQLIDDRERLHSLLKADLKEFAVSTTSPMPSYQTTLRREEIGDVLAYLLSLKGQ